LSIRTILSKRLAIFSYIPIHVWNRNIKAIDAIIILLIIVAWARGNEREPARSLFLHVCYTISVDLFADDTRRVHGETLALAGNYSTLFAGRRRRGHTDIRRRRLVIAKLLCWSTFFPLLSFSFALPRAFILRIVNACRGKGGISHIFLTGRAPVSQHPLRMNVSGSAYIYK